MQVEEFFIMWVGSLIIWFKPNWDVSNLSFKPSVVLLSFEYQVTHVALKSLIKIVKKGLKRDTVSRLDSKLSINLLNSSWFWLQDLYNEINLQIFFSVENSIFKQISYSELLKEDTIFNKHKHHHITVRGMVTSHKIVSRSFLTVITKNCTWIKIRFGQT